MKTAKEMYNIVFNHKINSTMEKIEKEARSGRTNILIPKDEYDLDYNDMCDLRQNGYSVDEYDFTYIISWDLG